MPKRNASRPLLMLGSVLLALTALLHGSGVAMVRDWTATVAAEHRPYLELVWLSDSWDWLVVAVIWFIAAGRPGTAWRSVAALLCAIPAATGIGLATVDPGFFGAYLLLLPPLLVLVGLWTTRRGNAAA